MIELARPIGGAVDDKRTMMIGCLRTPHQVLDYPVSFRDVFADSEFGMRMFKCMGVGKGDMVMFTSGSSEYAHFWAYEVSVERLEGCVAIAENFMFDAGRSEMFMRRLPIKLAFGITDAILDGMVALGLDSAKAFAAAGSICARDGAADRLRELGFPAWKMVSFGPTFGYVSPDGQTYYDTSEWLLEEAAGELLITAMKARAAPLVRLRTGVLGTVDDERNFSLT